MIENTPIKILFIEDNAAFARMLKFLLEEDTTHNWNIKHCASLNEGLACLHQESFDMIITDISFRDFKRNEIVKILKEANSIIPIVVLSAYPDRKLIDELLKQGAHKFFDKGDVLSEDFVHVLFNILNEASNPNLQILQ